MKVKQGKNRPQERSLPRNYNFVYKIEMSNFWKMNRIQLKIISDSCLLIAVIQRMKSFTYLVQCNEIKVLTSSFHMNGHSLRFDPRT